MIKVTVDTYGKTDAIKFLPADLLANLPAFTGRKDRTEEQIQEMVTSLLEDGQINDLTYRLSFDRKPILITGVTRALAADRINKQGLTDSKGNKYSKKEPFVLRAVYQNLSELEALFQTFRENDGGTRTAMTMGDEIAFVNVLNSNYGMTPQQISDKLCKNLAWVTKRLTAVTLDQDTLAKLNAGELSLDTAVTVNAIEPKFRAAAIEAANTAEGKVTAAGVAEAARNLGAKTGKTIKRSDKQIKEWLKSKLGADAPETPAKAFLFAFLDFKNGVNSIEDMDLAYAALVADENVSSAAA